MDEAVKRGIVTSKKQLISTPGEEWLRTDLDELVESDWTAYDFVHRNRKLLASRQARRTGCFRAATSSASIPAAGASTSGR